MKRFFGILLILVIIAGGLYGAWTALEFFDNTRAAYREELARSQLLNLTNQQRIADLLEENSQLREELDEIRSLPAFAVAMQEEISEPDTTNDTINIQPNYNTPPQRGVELEESENVRHQTNPN